MFIDMLSIRGQSKKREKAMTLIELLLVVAIVGTLSAIAVPISSNYIDKQRKATAITDIRRIEGEISRFLAVKGSPPNSLADAGISTQHDPWGRDYVYQRIQGLSKAEMDAKCRWDKYDKPLNNDFDLYSVGKDGESKPKITHKDSYDDIIRAHDGTYVGPASEY